MMYKKLIIGMHDKFNIHKILGYSALIHYVYRYIVLLKTGSMNFRNDYYDLLIPALHFMLSLTSFIFRVSERRNFKHQIIWKELQLHNIIFTARSCSIFAYLTIYPSSNIIIRLLIVMFYHSLADLVTQKYKQSTTMRSMSYDETIFPAYLKKGFDLYYSLSQFGAIVSLIIATSGREYALTIMFAIQISAFLMTLNLKGFIKSDTWHLVYSLSLLCTWLLPSRTNVKETWSMLVLVYGGLRLLGLNKYLIMVLIVILKINYY